MTVDRTQSSLDPLVTKSAVAAVASGGSLRILIDHTVVEMYSGDGRSVASFRVYPTLADSIGITLVSENAVSTFNVDAWALSAIPSQQE